MVHLTVGLEKGIREDRQPYRPRLLRPSQFEILKDFTLFAIRLTPPMAVGGEMTIVSGGLFNQEPVTTLRYVRGCCWSATPTLPFLGATQRRIVVRGLRYASSPALFK